MSNSVYYKPMDAPDEPHGEARLVLHGKHSPDNVRDVIDRVSVITREDSRDVSRHRFKLSRPGWAHQSLRCWDQAWKKNPPRQRRDLGIGDHGTLSQNGKETYNVKLQRVD